MARIAFVIEQYVGSYGWVAVGVDASEAEANRLAALWTSALPGKFRVAKYEESRVGPSKAWDETSVPAKVAALWFGTGGTDLMMCFGTEDAARMSEETGGKVVPSRFVRSAE
jgi:hypothetical protein